MQPITVNKSMKLLINSDQTKPLTTGQLIEFLQTQDPNGEILILQHLEGSLMASPLTEVLVPEGRTTPEFISMITRDEMNKTTKVKQPH